MDATEKKFFFETFEKLCQDGKVDDVAKSNRLFNALIKIVALPDVEQDEYIVFIKNRIEKCYLTVSIAHLIGQMIARVNVLLTPIRVPKLLHVLIPMLIEKLARTTAPFKNFLRFCGKEKDKLLDAATVNVLRFMLNMLLAVKDRVNIYLLHGLKHDYVKATVNILFKLTQRKDYAMNDADHSIISKILDAWYDDDTVKSLQTLATTALEPYIARHITKAQPNFTLPALQRMKLRSTRIKPDPSFLLEEAEKLPVCQQIDRIFKHIDDNRISLIVSDTGSGKSTQIPRKLVEKYDVKVIVTIPRVVSCKSNAEYVAKLFGRNGPKYVGVRTRPFKSHASEELICYCSTGTVQHYFAENSDMLRNSTHLIIDEAHESNQHNTLLFILIKKFIHRYPNLRVVIMSATVSESMFTEYFGCQSFLVTVPRKFQLEQIYLDDFIEKISKPFSDILVEEKSKTVQAMYNDFMNVCNTDHTKLIDLIEWITGFDELRHLRLLTIMKLSVTNGSEKLLLSPLLAAIHFEDMESLQLCQVNGALEFNADYNEALQFAETFNKVEPLAFLRSLNTGSRLGVNRNGYDVTNVQIATLVEQLMNDNKKYVLIFMAGLSEINQLRAAIMDRWFFKQLDVKKKLLLVIMHSSTSAEQQDAAFSEKFEFKIVLSTNICESSVTINNIDCVIDSGYHKEGIYDYAKTSHSLKAARVSKDSSKQRAGRAGRTKKGQFYALYSAAAYAELRDIQTPEIELGRIDDFCLTIKHYFPTMKILDVLAESLHTIDECRIKAAILHLQELYLLDENENFTMTGLEVKKLPLSVESSRSILWSLFFGCLDPVLICVAFETMDPYTMYRDDKNNLCSSRMNFSKVGRSDIKVNYFAYEEYMNAEDQWAMCRDKKLKMHEMQKIHNIVQLTKDRVKSLWMYKVFDGCVNVNRNSNNWFYIHSAIGFGYCAQIGYARGTEIYTPSNTYAFPDRASMAVYTGYKSTQLPNWSNFVIYERLDETTKTWAIGLSAITPLVVHICRLGQYDEKTVESETGTSTSTAGTSTSVQSGGFGSFPTTSVASQGTRILSQEATKAGKQIFDSACEKDPTLSKLLRTIRKRLRSSFNDVQIYEYNPDYIVDLTNLEQLRYIEQDYFEEHYGSEFNFYID